MNPDYIKFGHNELYSATTNIPLRSCYIRKDSVIMASPESNGGTITLCDGSTFRLGNFNAVKKVSEWLEESEG